MLDALLDLLFPPQCAACGHTGSGLCVTCLPLDAPLQNRVLASLQARALGHYDGALRQAVLALKSGRRDVARALGERLGARVTPDSLLVPVPTTARRRAERGFDGCELLACHAIAVSGARMVRGLQHVASDAQRGRGRVARLQARGRFAWRGEQIRGRRILLLDDVITTGATLEDCAAALRAEGAIVENALAAAVVREDAFCSER